MTAKQIFEYALVELNKKEAPSLLLEDYNYFINKAVNQYINKIYNAYDVNQQKSDDLRVLKATAILTPVVTNDYGSGTSNNLFVKAYEMDLPDDYLHILNCVVEYTVLKTYKCYDINEAVQFGARRLTADMFSQILNNYYLRPTYKNPYYYINNVNVGNTYATQGDTQAADPVVYGTGTPSPNVERIDGKKYGNKSKVRMEVRYGKDASTFQLSQAYIDYLKAPNFIRLAQTEIDKVDDTSQVLEFPDYVCQEIVNELVKLLMENGSDPRLQTHIPINQSIAQPQQEQASPQQASHHR